MDLFGLYEGIGMDTPNKEAVICGRFIKKVSQMDGTQLAHFLRDYSFEGFNVSLTFHIPFTTDFINTFLRDTKRDGQTIRIESAGKQTESERTAMVDAIRQCLAPYKGGDGG